MEGFADRSRMDRQVRDVPQADLCRTLKAGVGSLHFGCPAFLKEGGKARDRARVNKGTLMHPSIGEKTTLSPAPGKTSRIRQ